MEMGKMTDTVCCSFYANYHYNFNSGIIAMAEDICYSF